jgi:hypothetical protein
VSAEKIVVLKLANVTPVIDKTALIGVWEYKRYGFDCKD